MTRFQKVFCVILSLCFFAVLAMAPEWLFLGGNIYRQLPLYRFLEEKARSMSQREDPETYQLLVGNGAGTCTCDVKLNVNKRTYKQA